MISIAQFTFLLAILGLTHSFTPIRTTPSSSSRLPLTMVWGLQKLGNPTKGIEINPDEVVVDKHQPFGSDRLGSGSGVDERCSVSEETESDWETVSKIDKMMRQRTLEMALGSSTVGDTQKVRMIEAAADVEGLLPSSFSSMKPASLTAAGLLNDWEFDME